MSSREDLYPSRQLDRPEWLERQDPVLYRQDLEAAPVAPELMARFERDGYMVLPELFSPQEVAVLRAELDRLRQDPEVLASDEAIREPQSGALRSLFEIHKSNPLFARVAGDARIAEVARFILGGDIYIHQSRMNFKPGFNGKEFYWHSDFETWHAEDGMPRMRAVSASLMLTDNLEFNGPLMLVPGSHRHFIPTVGETPDNNWQTSLQHQRVGVPSEEVLGDLIEQHGIVAPKGPAGSLLLFDCNTLHASNRNLSPWPRSNLFFVYNSVENTLESPFSGSVPRPDFLASRSDGGRLA